MRQDGKIELQCCNSKIVGGGDWGIMGKVISPAEETGDIRRQEQTISNTTEPVCSGNHTKKTALEWRARSSMIIHDHPWPIFTDSHCVFLAQENESNVFLTSCRLNAKKIKKAFGSWNVLDILFDNPHRPAARDFTDYQSLRWTPWAWHGRNTLNVETIFANSRLAKLQICPDQDLTLEQVHHGVQQAMRQEARLIAPISVEFCGIL